MDLPRRSPPTLPSPRSTGERVVACGLWMILSVCCGLPLAWLVVQLATHPHVIADAVPDRFRWWLIARTFGFNAMAAILATLIAIPVGLAISIGRGLGSRLLGIVVCVPLLMPSLVMTYGWKQVYAVFGYDPMPQSAADVLRCVVALASWIWPVPAMTLAFALRRIDPDLLQQARLEGVEGRMLVRLAAGPVVLGFLAAMLLSLQEFAVFEPSGISVIATEVRAVFETGSSLDLGWSILADRADGAGPSQEERTGAALAVMLPTLVATIVFAALCWRWTTRLGDGIDWHATDDRHRCVRLPGASVWLGYALALLAVGSPIIAMVRSMRTTFNPIRIANEYWPQIVGSTTLAILAASVGVLLLVIASIARVSTRAIWLALAAFLVGGQWIAIALIVVFNRDVPGFVYLYDSKAMPVIAYVARFAWIPLCAAAMTWTPGTRWLRDLAATDGAGRWTTWRYVVAPLAWPLLAGAAILMFTLSLTEVPATTLLQPAGTLVPMLMTWAHILNYDAMIEASLLLAIVVLMSGVGVAWLVRTGARWMK
jgi:ABC-type Fe3+ transport system permease subunit